MRPEVFISYASRDVQDAARACEVLESNGVTCWIAPRNIAPGAVYAEAILQGIEASRAVLLVLSNAANQSDHVLREIERAVSKRKRVVTLRIEDVQLSKALEYFIGTVQWVDAVTGSRDTQLEKIAAELRATAPPAADRPAASSLRVHRKQEPTSPPPISTDLTVASTGDTVARWQVVPSLPVTASALSRDAEWILVGGERGEVCLFDRRGVTKWSDATRHRVACAVAGAEGLTLVGNWAGHLSAYIREGFEWRVELEGVVSAIAIDRASEVIVAGTWAGQLGLFHRDGSAIELVELPEAVVRVAVAPDGSFAVAQLADRSIAAVDRDGVVRWRREHSAGILLLQCWPHETLVVTDDGVISWLADDGQETHRVATRRELTLVRATVDGGAVLAVDRSRTVYMYERLKDRPKWEVVLAAPPDSIAVSGKTASLLCAVALSSSSLVAINQFKQLKELRLPVRAVSLELSSSGGFASCQSAAGELCFLQLDALKEWLAPAKVTFAARNVGSYVEGQVAGFVLHLTNEGDRNARQIRLTIRSEFLRKAQEEMIAVLEPGQVREVKRAIEPTRAGEVPLTIVLAYIDELGKECNHSQELFIKVLGGRGTGGVGNPHG